MDDKQIKTKNMNFYTTFETSKQLREWGCKLYSNTSICEDGFVQKKLKKMIEFEIEKRIGTKYEGNIEFTFHLLEDVCVRHAKGFFGEEFNARFDKCSHIEMILNLIATNKKEKAEEYFLETTIFNPKNK